MINQRLLTRPAQPQSAAVEDRTDRRHKVFQPAVLICGSGGEGVRIHLLDLSAGGALAHSDSPPDAKSRVTVSCAMMDWDATVVWARGRRFGLRFVQPLSDRMIERIAAG